MTTVQDEKIEVVRQILNEHFEGWVLVVQIEIDDRRETLETFYHGGYFNAIGLLQKATLQTENSRQQSQEPESD